MGATIEVGTYGAAVPNDKGRPDLPVDSDFKANSRA